MFRLFSVYSLADKKFLKNVQLQVVMSLEHFNRAKPNVYAHEYLIITLKNAIKCISVSALLCIYEIG